MLGGSFRAAQNGKNEEENSGSLARRNIFKEEEILLMKKKYLYEGRKLFKVVEMSLRKDK